MGLVTKVIIMVIAQIVGFVILSYYINGWYALFLGNAVIGYSILHIVWNLVPRYLTPNEERDSLFPAFRRLDSQHWNFYMFIPGAISLFCIRAVVSLGSLVVLMIWLRICMIGHKYGKEPLQGWRLWCNYTAYNWASWLIVSSSFMSMKLHHVEVDYSEYLGKDYLKT